MMKMTPVQASYAWRKLPLSLTELCIDTTLRCGQSFRWRKIDDEWHCALHGRLLSLKQDKDHLHYKASWPSSSRQPEDASGDNTESLLKHYFSLKYDLTALYEQWSDSDANFRKKAPKFTGIRILSQDAWEALVAFICSSNNNISRIAQMVDKLCLNYGTYIGKVGDVPFHDFPSPEALSGKNVESKLRELGFGYRAKYIVATALELSQVKPQGWLEGLTNPANPPFGHPPSDEPATYRSAHEELVLLSGVGPKVADCVCLMGLGWGESVPVDTHVWQIAQRDYKFGKSKAKTLNKAMYDAVGDYFRGIWGPHAGWAQSVLFTANLRSFADQAAAKLEAKDEEDVKPAANVTVKLEEEVEEVVVKKETAADEPPPTRLRKRQVRVVETVKVEKQEDGLQQPVKRESKRRRTRG